MMTRRVRGRGGFTLIEIVVVLGLLVLAMGVTAMFAALALDRDRAEKAVNQLTASAGVARSRAQRDGLPYGLRFLTNGGNQATTCQFIQSAPVLSLNPAGPSNANIYLQFEYTLDANGAIPASPSARACCVYGLNAAQQAQITPSSTLYLPTFGTWHTVTAVAAAPSPRPAGTLALTLDTYPDFSLGAATHIRLYEFGLYTGPRAVLGEEVIQLPQLTCVDFALSQPAVPSGVAHYDLLWAPSGRLVTVPPPSPNTGAFGTVFLWVRNPEKSSQPYENGGEQLLVVIKAQSGAVGGAPIDWGADPFALGRKALAGH